MKIEAGVWKVKTTQKYSLLKINSRPVFFRWRRSTTRNRQHQAAWTRGEQWRALGGRAGAVLASLVGEQGRRWRWWVGRGRASRTLGAGGRLEHGTGAPSAIRILTHHRLCFRLGLLFARSGSVSVWAGYYELHLIYIAKITLLEDFWWCLVDL
jgi:hypothetical protein